jgi:hypothetical protein
MQQLPPHRVLSLEQGASWRPAASWHPRNWRTAYLRLLVVIPFVASCAGGPSFRARHEPGYTGAATVSVFGVFKDGRLDADGWSELGSSVVPFAPCEAAFSPDLASSNPELASAVDDYASAHGVTDSLLKEWATSAEADTILLLSIAGHAPRRTGPTQYTLKQRIPGQHVLPASPYDAHVPTDGSRFQLTATLFSVRLGRSIAELDMTTSSSNTADVMAAFKEHLASDLGVRSCKGWSPPSGSLNSSRIRELPDD